MMEARAASDTLVSVIIPCFNVRPYVGAALRSLLAQSHAEWEALVVDDGSTDGTAELVEAVVDSRIRLIRQANQGVSAARNRALDLATGETVLFLDADDWLAPDALARMLACLRTQTEARTVAAYGAFCFVTEDGAQVVRRKDGPFPAGDLTERLLVENLFANGGHLLIRTHAIRAAGRFRGDLRFGEDWEYWCRLALLGPFAVVPGPALLFVRQRSSGAFLRMATDPGSLAPCTEAIFNNPELARRLDPHRLSALRALTDAENNWIVGREQVRHRRRAAGLRCLRRSFQVHPSLKRGILLVLAHLLPVLPHRLAGPFRPYGGPDQ